MPEILFSHFISPLYKNSPKVKILELILAFFTVAALMHPNLAHAQIQYVQEGYMSIKARAIDPATIKSNTSTIHLWGIKTPENMNASLALQSRTALDNLIAGQALECDLSFSGPDQKRGQCMSYNNTDIALAMVQSGYAVIDRSVIYNSAYEKPYLVAEEQARAQNKGIWGTSTTPQSNAKTDIGLLPIVLICALFSIVILLIVSVLITLRRGFYEMIDAQMKSIEIFKKEQKLKDKEKFIIASIFEGEISANKNKIEAYIMIYNEMIANLKNPDERPKYMDAGDIVQRQPALERGIFDKNTDKLDLLDTSLSSKIIHYYAQIKTNPEYITIEPNMPQEEAYQIVKNVIEKAEKLSDLSHHILKLLPTSLQNSKEEKANSRKETKDMSQIMAKKRKYQDSIKKKEGDYLSKVRTDLSLSE